MPLIVEVLIVGPYLSRHRSPWRLLAIGYGGHAPLQDLQFLASSVSYMPKSDQESHSW
jgi:hypothetical protein